MRGQSRFHSLLEAVASVAVGFLISVTVQIILMRAYGLPHDVRRDVEITLVFTVVSIARGYCMRRLFNWWGTR